MKSQKNAKVSFTLWQEAGENNVPEPALTVECYHGNFSITQDGRSILFNYESIPDLIKFLKIVKEPESDRK